MTNQLAAIYARVSTWGQTTGIVPSTDTQVTACHAKGVALGLAVAPDGSDYIVKEKHSGTDLLWQGSRFMELVRRAQRQEFTDLICLDVDRFCRGGPEAYFEQMGYLTEAGIKVHWVISNIPADMPFSKTITVARAEAAQWVIDKNREASMRVKTAYAAAGNYIPGRTPPFGFQHVEDPTLPHTKRGLIRKVCIEPDPATSAALLHMYEHIAVGGSSGALRVWMEAGEYRTPQGATQWHEQTIGRILRNPSNWGERMSYRTRRVKHPKGARRAASAKGAKLNRPVPLAEQYQPI